MLALLLLGCSFAGQHAHYVVSLPPLEKRPIIAHLDERLQSRVFYTLYIYSADGAVQKWLLREEESLNLSLEPSSVLLCYPQLVSHDKLEFKPYGAWLHGKQDDKRIALAWEKGFLALLMRRAQEQGIALYRFNFERLAASLSYEDAWFFDEIKLKEALLKEKLLKRDFQKKPSLALKKYNTSLWHTDAYLTGDKDYLQLPTGTHMLFNLGNQYFFKIQVNRRDFHLQKLQLK